MAIVSTILAALKAYGAPKAARLPTPSRVVSADACDPSTFPALHLTDGSFWKLNLTSSNCGLFDNARTSLWTIAASDFVAGLGGSPILLAVCPDYDRQRLYAIARNGSTYGIGYKTFAGGAFVFRSTQTPAFTSACGTFEGQLQMNSDGSLRFYSVGNNIINQKTNITEASGSMTAAADVTQKDAITYFSSAIGSAPNYYASDESSIVSFGRSTSTTSLAMILTCDGDQRALSLKSKWFADGLSVSSGALIRRIQVNGQQVSMIALTTGTLSGVFGAPRHYLRSEIDRFFNEAFE